ncbi:copper amine oxidase N-terminal domain-containing protein [Wukongibacter baidiensis]|uniref:copper amine oxidase N-terminal domain-containing protein n=1 Tax=Wukongibacter baidiensis TaxID=1723361 RepID=UPI003D7F69E7
MNRKWSAFIGSIILISAITIGSVYASNSIKLIVNNKEVKLSVPLHISNGRTIGSIRDVAEALGASVEWDNENQTVKITDKEKQELKRRIELLEFALISDSPEGIASTWAKGVISRNGALQYAVLCDNLQIKYKSSYESWDWITGASSPWIDEFVIESKEELDDGTWRFSIKFHWTDSTRSSSYSTHNVIIGKKKLQDVQYPLPIYPGSEAKWCVISVEKAE